MSAAGTVVATSAEGAGDMPSLEQSAGAEGSGDGAPTFSQVLSLSAPDLPNPNGVPTQSVASLRPDGTSPETSGAARQNSSPEPARSSGKRGGRRTDPSGPREGHGHRATSAATPSADRTGAAGAVSPSSPVPSQAEASAIDQQQGAAALALAPTAFTGTQSSESSAADASGSGGTDHAPPVPLTAFTVGSIVSNDAPSGDVSSDDAPSAVVPSNVAPANDTAANDTASNDTASNDAPSATVRAEIPGDGSDQDGIGSGPPSGVRTPEVAPGVADARVSADRAPLGSNTVHGGSESVQGAPSASASASVAATSTSGAVNAGGGAGAAAGVSVSADEAPELAEFPAGGAGTAAPTVDINDLAASISRPLAGGNGEYSVQVSLHPPELGEVRALLSLQGDVLHVTLTPEHASGLDALADAMPALHEQLAGGGLEVNVTLGQPGDAQGDEGRGPGYPRPRATDTPDDATPAVTPSGFSPNSGGPGRIYLVL
jgi:flagellar hook-length control protein FliK